MQYEIKDVCFFDTETTGVPAKGLDWEKDCDQFPYVAQLAWLKDGVLKSYIIKPIGADGKPYEIPEATTEIHGISTERAMKEGVPFETVVQEFIKDCTLSPLICAHNIYFDTSILKANIMRYLGREYYDSKADQALFKGKRIDTMMKTIKFVGACFADGRAGKFPTLEELYAKCFEGKAFPAHDAGEDVKALAACLPVLVELGFIELAQKQYDEDGKPKRTAGTRAKRAAPAIKKTKIVKAKAIFDDEPVELPKSNHYESEETKSTTTEKSTEKPTTQNVSNRNALLDAEDF